MSKPLELTIGPFVGMSDGLNLAGQDGKRAAYIENMYAVTSSIDGDLMSRPGVTRIPFVRTISTRVSCGTWTLTGTVAFTNGSAAVVGTGTAFQTELAVNEYIRNTGSATYYQILSITDDTHLTLTSGVGVVASSGTELGAASGGTPNLVYTATADAIQVGDLIQAGASDTRLITVRNSANIFSTSAIFATGGYSNGSAVDTQAAVTGGKIYGVYRYANTDGTVRRFILATTTSSEVVGVGPGTYRFLGAGAEKIRLVEYDPSATYLQFTDRTSASMNGVALDLTKRIYGLTFANYLILSDGTNRPRKISSTFVLTNLTDGNYAVKGAPVQYYGKLFIIDGSDNITIRWSEENDPDTGYGTGTSDNSWSLRQTSADGLEALAATNFALYCFRTNSVAIITGAANSDFRSSGSVDAIQNIGCRSPDAIALLGDSVVFWDQYGRPGRITLASGYIPLWARVINTIRGAGLSATNLRAAWCRYDPTTNLLKFGYRTASGSTTNDQLLTFEPDQWESMGVHKWYSTGTTAIDHAYSVIWEDENSVPRHVIASGTTGDVALYIQKTETSLSASAKDSLAADTTVPVIVETPKMGGDVLTEKLFSRMAVGTRNVGGGTTGITLWKSQYKGPYDTAYTTAEAMFVGNSATAPASMTLDGAAVKAEQVGLNVRGRWVQAKFTNDTTGNPATRATFDTVTLKATENGQDFGAR